MSFRIVNPSFELHPFVKHFWAIENCLPEGVKHTQRIVPNGLPELMFYFGTRPRVLDANKNFTENTILSGQQKSHYDIEVSGELSLFAVTFRPYGSRLLLDVPSIEVFNQNVPLKYLLKNRLAELEEKLCGASNFEEKVNLMEAFLTDRLKNINKNYEFLRIESSVELISRTGGIIDVETLASAACISRKQYERTFAEFIGSSPGQFIRTVKFQHAIYRRQQDENLNLTELAHACGYYDQSHMINEFKLLSGKTPRQFFSACEPFSDYYH